MNFKLTRAHFVSGWPLAQMVSDQSIPKSYQKIWDSAMSLKGMKEPQYEGIRWELSFIQTESEKLLKHDEVKNSVVLKRLLAKVVTDARTDIKMLTKLEKEYEKSGAAKGLIEADITLNLSNWDSQALDKNEVTVAVRSKRMREETYRKKINKGGLRIRGVMIDTEGYIALSVKPHGKKLKQSENGTSYKFSGKELKVKAQLVSSNMTIEATSFEEVAKKIGSSAEMSVGIEWVPFKLGGKAVSMKEAQKTKGTGSKLSWVLKVPSGGMKISTG